jgi:hypothetical protein
MVPGCKFFGLMQFPEWEEQNARGPPMLLQQLGVHIEVVTMKFWKQEYEV